MNNLVQSSTGFNDLAGQFFCGLKVFQYLNRGGKFADAANTNVVCTEWHWDVSRESYILLGLERNMLATITK